MHEHLMCVTVYWCSTETSQKQSAALSASPAQALPTANTHLGTCPGNRARCLHHAVYLHHYTPCYIK